MKTYFLELNDMSPINALLKTLVLTTICTILIYTLFFLFSKILYRKSEFRRDNTLRLSLFWAFVAFMLLFTIYLFFLIRSVGIESFAWQQWRFYLIVAPYLIVFWGSIITFIILYSQSNKTLKPLNL